MCVSADGLMLFGPQWLHINELQYTKNEIRDDPLDEEWLNRVQKFRNNVRSKPIYHEEHPYASCPYITASTALAPDPTPRSRAARVAPLPRPLLPRPARLRY